MSTALRSASAPARTPSPRRGAPERTPTPPLQVVAPRARRRRAGVAAAAGLLFAFGVMLGLVLFQTQLAKGQARLDQLEREVRAEQVRYDTLRGEVALLSAPGRIVEAARAQGMVTPTEVRYVSATPEAVAALVTATGEAPGLPAGAPDRPVPGTSEWSTVKPIVGGAP